MTAPEPAVPTGPPAQAAAVFGARLPIAERYVAALAGDGVTRGLIGPREVPVLWTRHVLNGAAVAELVDPDTRLVDVGSGAGLPGLAVALARPDLAVDLVEPLERRCVFLREMVDELGLSAQVRVVRGRAEDHDVRTMVSAADAVTARAVAPLSRLVRWCLPLVRPAGRLLAVKGARAEVELDEARRDVRAAGGEDPHIVSVGRDEYATRVVVVTRTSGRGQRGGRQ